MPGAGSLQSPEKALSLILLLCLPIRRMYRERFHLPISVWFCYCLLDILTGSLQTSWRGPGVLCVGAGPPVSLASPAAFSCSTQSPWLVSGQALEGGFPFWTPEPVPWGRDTASRAATEGSSTHWMPWSLDGAAPGARAVVVWGGVGCRHAAAPSGAVLSGPPGLVF